MARKKKERESSLHLTDKHHPLLGIVATLLAVRQGCLALPALLQAGVMVMQVC